MTKTIFYIGALLLIVIVSTLAYITWQERSSDVVGSRIIYGTSATAEEEQLWRVGCTNLRGQFETCGSPCTNDAETCISVCAFTCENIPSQ